LSEGRNVYADKLLDVRGATSQAGIVAWSRDVRFPYFKTCDRTAAMKLSGSHKMKPFAVIFLLLTWPAFGQIYDATFPVAPLLKPSPVLEPGMKPAFWCDAGNWMCPPASRAKHGLNRLLPADHQYAWFNPQESDLDAIIAEADQRKAAGADPLVILDFEVWISEPATFPRIAELLRYYKAKSGRPAMFYPGGVSLGFKHDWEVAAFLRPDGEFRGYKVDAQRRAEIDAAAAKALPVYAASDLYVSQIYSYTDAQLRNGDFELVIDSVTRLRAHYFPRRPVLTWAMAHHLFEKGEPVIAPELLPMFARLIQKYNPDKQVAVWGPATPSARMLSRLLMGEAVDVRAMELKPRIDATDAELARIREVLLKATIQPPATQPSK